MRLVADVIFDDLEQLVGVSKVVDDRHVECLSAYERNEALFHHLDCEDVSTTFNPDMPDGSRPSGRLWSNRWRVLWALFHSDGGACRYCGRHLWYVKAGGPASPELEHVWPKVNGGTDTFDNIVLACRPCNLSKGGRSLAEWHDALAERGRVTLAIRVRAALEDLTDVDAWRRTNDPWWDLDDLDGPELEA